MIFQYNLAQTNRIWREAINQTIDPIEIGAAQYDLARGHSHTTYFNTIWRSSIAFGAV